MKVVISTGGEMADVLDSRIAMIFWGATFLVVCQQTVEAAA